MYVHVRVIANQKNEIIEDVAENRYKISVKEQAKQNKANIRVIEILKEKFEAKRVKLVSGHHAPTKLFSIELE